MSSSFLETYNRASSDYPYIQSNTITLTCGSHFHDEIELVEMISGSIYLYRNGQKLLLREGDLCILMPGEIHSFESPSKNIMHIMKLSWKHSEESADFAYLFLPAPLSPASDLNQSIRAATAVIRNEHENKKEGYGYAIKEQSSRILCAMLRSPEIQRIAPIEYKKQRFSLSLLEKVNIYLEAHYTEPITLDEIASVCHLSSYYFAHLFKNATGTTFCNHLAAFRCGKATSFLSYGKENMTNIAFHCGFSDVRAFNRAFKKVYGTTPSSFRNDH
ncbi:MAG: helix-turn-helix transcriptional regulator [Clostridia bacterium]|nr:helix-turn-helix transcriptional regulator [Clostridia bacterium]